MKVLHIIKSLGRGGAEMLLQETLLQHNVSEFEFHYIYFLPWKDQMVEGLKKGGGKVTNLAASDNIRIMMKARQIIKYIRKNKIDLIHCHLPWAGFVGRYIYLRTKIPVIYTEHNKQERYHRITRLLNKISFNRQTAVIAVSNDVSESIKRNIHPIIPVFTILNGVNTNYFIRDHAAGLAIRTQMGISPETILIGTIAVFRFQKRLKEWISLMKIICSKKPGVMGCIVGDGILNADIRQFLKDEQMEDKILMPGLQTNVLPWMSAIDIYLMTSQFEGLPIALLEAMSMECAVVSTDAGGIKELIRHRQDGFIVPVNNWQELEKYLIQLIENPNEIKEWGAKARKRVVADFSITTMVNQTEELYRSFNIN